MLMFDVNKMLWHYVVMEITYKSKKLKKVCENKTEAIKAHGNVCGKLILRRVGEIKASETMAALKKMPAPRLHSLRGDRKREWAVDLKYPFRLVMLPGEEIKNDEDLDNIKEVKLLEVTDYHGK